MRSVTPLLSDADAGVRVTRPATSRNAEESPAVATGTVRVSSRSVLVLPGTVTDEMAPPPKIPPVPTTAVCGEPAWFVTETLKVADEEPLFTILNAFVFEKSLFSSSKPKFMLIENRSPFALAITCVAVDFAGCTSPVPPRLMRFASICDGSPVFTIAALMSSTVQDGCACRVSAATPATCGEAIEVPEIVAAPFPVPTPVETTATPGPEMSGFRPLSPVRGPPDEKLAKPLKFGFAIEDGVTVADWPSAARSRPPSDAGLVGRPRTPRNGIVTLNGTPVSGFEVIGPSTGGRPVSLLTITTARAPACWPKIAFATRAHVPRLTTAIVFGPIVPNDCTSQPSDSSAERVPAAPSGSTVVAGLSVITLTVYVCSRLERELVRVHRGHRAARDRDHGRREARRGVDRSGRDGALGRARRARDVLRRAAVAGGGDDDHAGLGRVRRGDCRRVVLRAEGRAQGHVDHVHVVVDRPLDRVDGDVGRAFAAEDADAVDVGLRRDAWTDAPAVAGDRRGVVGAVVGRARRGHARACGGAGDVRAVAVAVERVRVGMRDRLEVGASPGRRCSRRRRGRRRP